MKRALLSLMTAAFVVGLTAAAPVKAADEKAAAPKWTENYAAALAQAKKEKKMLLLDFTGSDWCGYCIKLHDAVFSKPEFAKWSTRFVLVELDYPHKKQLSAEIKKQNSELKTKYKIQGFPTIIILDADEKKLAEAVGYGGDAVADWTAARDAEIAKSKK